MIKEELTREEIHRFGESVLTQINQRFEFLQNDSDWIWQLHDDLELMKKLTVLVVNLQSDKVMIIKPTTNKEKAK